MEIFQEIWRTARRFDPARESPLAWLLAIARIRSLERLRAAGNVVPMSERVDSTAPTAGTGGGPEPWHFQEAKTVCRVLAAVPAEQRAAIEMAFFEGGTPEDIAGRLRVSPETIRTRIRFGMSALRGGLQDTIRRS